MGYSVVSTLLIILCSLNQADSEVYCITTKTPDLRNIQPCLTLSQFATNLSRYLHSNTTSTLVFLPGTHHLSNVNLTLSHMENFLMKSENLTAKIKCTSDSNFHFSQTQSIHITNLEFIGCGGNQVNHVEEFLVNNTKFEGQNNSGTALKLIATTAQIINSIFVSNRKGSSGKYAASLGTYIGFIGGAIIATNGANINISRSKFEDNRAGCGGAIFGDNSMITITDNVSFVSNYATQYGGVLCSNRSVMTTISASTFNKNHLSNDGRGVLWSVNSVIIIEISEFHANGGGDVLAIFYSTIIIQACKFDRNGELGVLITL